MSIEVRVNRLHRFERAEKKLKAFADIEVNGAILVKGLQIVHGVKGLFVSMPRQKGKDNRWYEIVRSVTPEVKRQIIQTVLNAYKEEKK